MIIIISISNNQICITVLNYILYYSLNGESFEYDFNYRTHEIWGHKLQKIDKIRIKIH